MKINQYCVLIIASILLASCAHPLAKFNVDVDKKDAPGKIRFENLSENAETYEIDLGDGKGFMKLDSATLEHRYFLSGTYRIKLKAMKDKKTNILEKKVVIDPPHECLVLISTPMGDMIAKLYDETPKHKENFLKLAEDGYYNDLIFHRVIKDFMIQGGDPQSRNATPEQGLGSGGPGYQIDAEFKDNLVHVKGALAAARMGDQMNPEKKSSGSQFYIAQGKPVDADQLDMMERRKGAAYSSENREIYMTQGGTPFLDYEYTVFGRVIEGLDVIDKIANLPTSRSDRPLENITMKISVIK